MLEEYRVKNKEQRQKMRRNVSLLEKTKLYKIKTWSISNHNRNNRKQRKD